MKITPIRQVEPHPHAAPDLARIMDLATRGTAVSLQLVAHDGSVLWEAQGSAGATRMHAAPPAEQLARTAEIHLYLEEGTVTPDDTAELYLGLLGCGCSVYYAYRPSLTAHCPSHGTRRVRRVDYPYDQEPLYDH